MGLKLLVNNYKGKLTGQNKDLVFDSASALVIRIGAAISSFLMNLVIARRLDTFYSGNFFLCYAVITVLATFVRLGGDNLLVRYVGIYGSEQKWKTIKLVVTQVTKRSFIFSVVISAVLILFHTFIAKYVFHKENISGTLFWMLLSTPLLALYTLLSFVFQGLKKVLISVSIQNILVPVTLSILVLIIRPSDSEKAAELYFISSVITMLITLVLWSRNAQKGEENEEAKLPERIWKSSYALWSLTIMQMAMQWGGQFMAGIFCTQKQVAQLAVAQRTSILISFILISINLVCAPRFANLYKQGQLKNLKKYAINSTRLMVAFSTPIVLLIICFPTLIMSMFGKGFESGASILVILSLGQYVNVLTGSVTLLLMMSGHERDTRNIQIFIGILGSILNYFLIKHYGVLGAAIGTALAMATQNLICVGMVKKRLGFNTMAIFSK